MRWIQVCSLAGMVCFAAMAATAQEARDQVDRTRTRVQAGNLDAKTRGVNIRASQLIGMNIQNSAGEGLGEVNDLVLNASTGKIRYAAVTYGGFLGIGNKMFAVPFEAFKFQRDPNDADDYILVLDVTQKQLKGAVGFDEEHWPNFADKKFTMELDKRYGVQRDDRTDVNDNRNRESDR